MSDDHDLSRTLTIPPEMAVTVSQALLAPVIDRIKTWGPERSQRLGMGEIAKSWLAPIDTTCSPQERGLLKLSREVVGLDVSDSVLDQSWETLVETYDDVGEAIP